MEEILNRLKDIGVEEISKKTHISVAKIRAILDKDFEHLDRVGAVGFIHILEREYKVDLTEWIEAYDEYYKENKPEKKEIELKTSFIAKKEEIERRGSGGKLWLFLSVIAIVVVLFFAFFDRKDIDKVAKSIFSTASSPDSKSYSDTQKESVEEIITIDKDRLTETKKLIDDELVVASVPVDENISAVMDEVNQTTSEDRVIPESNSSIAAPKASDINQTTATKIVIEPKSRLWIGTINLRTKAKTSTIISTPYELSSEDPLLILTGHGNLTLIEGDKKESLTGIVPLRFILDKNGLRRIGFEEFKKLNGGSSW